jgi:hypothetical protein
MKTIIAGSRSITDPAVVYRAVAASRFRITHVVSGTAAGVDTIGEAWTRSARRGPSIVVFP